MLLQDNVLSTPVTSIDNNLPKILNTLEMKRDAININIVDDSPKKESSNVILKSSNYNISEIYNVRQLLINLHKSSNFNAHLHSRALKYYSKINSRCNIFLLSLSLLSSIAIAILSRVDHEIEQVVSSIMLTTIGGLGVILNRLGFQSKIEKHREAVVSYTEIVDLIEIAMAYANDNDGNYDFTYVLNEVQQIKHNLNKYTPPIPDNIEDDILFSKF